MTKIGKPSILIFLGCICATVAISLSAFLRYARMEDVVRGALVILALALFQIGQVMMAYEKELESLRKNLQKR